MRVNFFARNDLRGLLPLPVHDDNIAPQDLTTVKMNYQWRVFVVSILENLQEYNSRILDDADIDAFNEVYNDFLIDMYS